MMDTLVMTPKTIENQLKKIALLVRYGTKEVIFIAIGLALFVLAKWVPQINEFFKLPPELSQPIALGLYAFWGLCLL
jgi:hypothetical protein